LRPRVMGVISIRSCLLEDSKKAAFAAFLIYAE